MDQRTVWGLQVLESQRAPWSQSNVSQGWLVTAPGLSDAVSVKLKVTALFCQLILFFLFLCTASEFMRQGESVVPQKKCSGPKICASDFKTARHWRARPVSNQAFWVPNPMFTQNLQCKVEQWTLHTSSIRSRMAPQACSTSRQLLVLVVQTEGQCRAIGDLEWKLGQFYFFYSFTFCAWGCV